MVFDLSAAAMLFFWLTAEIIILNYVSKVWHKILLKKDRSIYTAVLSLLLLLFVFVVTFTEIGKNRLDYFEYYRFYYQLYADLYCTLYILIESYLTVYAAYIYWVTKCYFENKDASYRNHYLQQKKNSVVAWLLVLTLIFLGLYFAYHIIYAQLIFSGKLDYQFLTQKFHFYFFICGFLWVIIDFIAAYFAFRFYKLLAKNRELINEFRR